MVFVKLIILVGNKAQKPASIVPLMRIMLINISRNHRRVQYNTHSYKLATNHNGHKQSP